MGLVASLASANSESNFVGIGRFCGDVIVHIGGVLKFQFFFENAFDFASHVFEAVEASRRVAVELEDALCWR